MIMRMFDTAIDPEDVERAKDLFRKEVRPAFEAFDGCRGIYMYIGLDEHSGGFVDVAAISRWESRDHINKALASREYKEALAEMKQLFEQAPIVRHFEQVE
jgi:heme-degrading monooxygenase HmoA